MANVHHFAVVIRALPTLLGLTVSALIPSASLVAQKDCTRTSTGRTPIMDMGTARYKTYPGNLYSGGNNPPPAHAADGIAASAAIRPLDGNGNPSPTGRIVLVSIGMSNTTQEFSRFVQMSDSDPRRNPAVRVVDLAQGGHDARKVAQPNHNYWAVAAQRLQNAGVTKAQVQVAWIKQAIARPTKPFPNNAIELRDLLAQIARNLKTQYPNIKIAYYSSRIYAGYAGTQLNPEPFAYEGGFATKWLIEQQIQRQGNLNHDPNRGTVVAPWLAWGPYLWADGTRPRSDGLTYLCSDFANDGTHPAAGARQKVADLLTRHFTTEATAKSWYGGGGGGNVPILERYGRPCSGSLGPLRFRWNSLPQIGNQNFALGVNGARPGTLALFYLSAAQDNTPIQGCTLWIDFGQTLFSTAMQTNSNGAAILRAQIPNDQALLGATAYAQWFNQDSRSGNLQLLGGGAATEGVKMVVGR